jgi:hypothetical protein
LQQEGFVQLDVAALLKPHSVLMTVLQKRLTAVFTQVKLLGGPLLASAELTLPDVSVPLSKCALHGDKLLSRSGSGSSDSEEYWNAYEPITPAVTPPPRRATLGDAPRTLSRHCSQLLEQIDLLASTVNDDARQWAAASTPLPVLSPLCSPRASWKFSSSSGSSGNSVGGGAAAAAAAAATPESLAAALASCGSSSSSISSSEEHLTAEQALEAALLQSDCLCDEVSALVMSKSYHCGAALRHRSQSVANS